MDSIIDTILAEQGNLLQVDPTANPNTVLSRQTLVPSPATSGALSSVFNGSLWITGGSQSVTTSSGVGIIPLPVINSVQITAPNQILSAVVNIATNAYIVVISPNNGILDEIKFNLFDYSNNLVNTTVRVNWIAILA